MKNAEMKEQAQTVTISKKEYDSLLDDRKWRECLECGGVDNWNGMVKASKKVAIMMRKTNEF